MISSTTTILIDKRIPPYNTTLGSKESMISKPRSRPSSIPILKYLVLIRNCQLAQASDAWIHQLDNSIESEVSTLASSTLVAIIVVGHQIASKVLKNHNMLNNKRTFHVSSRILCHSILPSRQALQITGWTLFTSHLFYLFLRIREALEHLASFTSSRKTISQLRIEPPNTPFNLGTYSPSSRILGSCQTIHIPFILMKDKVIPLSLDNPQDIIAKEQPNQAKPPKVFPQTLLK